MRSCDVDMRDRFLVSPVNNNGLGVKNFGGILQVWL